MEMSQNKQLLMNAVNKMEEQEKTIQSLINQRDNLKTLLIQSAERMYQDHEIKIEQDNNISQLKQKIEDYNFQIKEVTEKFKKEGKQKEAKKLQYIELFNPDQIQQLSTIGDTKDFADTIVKMAQMGDFHNKKK